MKKYKFYYTTKKSIVIEAPNEESATERFEEYLDREEPDEVTIDKVEVE